jgi:hypothetical protein
VDVPLADQLGRLCASGKRAACMGRPFLFNSPSLPGSGEGARQGARDYLQKINLLIFLLRKNELLFN